MVCDECRITRTAVIFKDFNTMFNCKVIIEFLQQEIYKELLCSSILR